MGGDWGYSFSSGVWLEWHSYYLNAFYLAAPFLDFCWEFFLVCTPYFFQVADFFSSKSRVYEAKRKLREFIITLFTRPRGPSLACLLLSVSLSLLVFPLYITFRDFGCTWEKKRKKYIYSIFPKVEEPLLTILKIESVLLLNNNFLDNSSFFHIFYCKFFLSLCSLPLVFSRISFEEWMVLIVVKFSLWFENFLCVILKKFSQTQGHKDFFLYFLLQFYQCKFLCYNSFFCICIWWEIRIWGLCSPRPWGRLILPAPFVNS